MFRILQLSLGKPDLHVAYEIEDKARALRDVTDEMELDPSTKTVVSDTTKAAIDASRILRDACYDERKAANNFVKAAEEVAQSKSIMKALNLSSPQNREDKVTASLRAGEVELAKNNLDAAMTALEKRMNNTIQKKNAAQKAGTSVAVIQYQLLGEHETPEPHSDRDRCSAMRIS